MSTSTGVRSSTIVWQWVSRAVASFFLILGSLVFVTFLETAELRWFFYALMGVGGALLYIVGLERSTRPLARWAQLAGWLMMVALSLVPSSLLFVQIVAASLAFPALFLRLQTSWYASGRPPKVDQQAG